VRDQHEDRAPAEQEADQAVVVVPNRADRRAAMKRFRAARRLYARVRDQRKRGKKKR
jgi:hypothetical protein